ncbi:MAG TPA: glycosyltransferase family protein [Caulobacteraceae bacterium]
MILAILQARMSSTRLPGKALRPLCGGPMILRQIERVRRSRRIDRLVVACSDDRTDDVLSDVLDGGGVEVFRGSLDDVLGRYAGALEAKGPADHVVRLTGDCPLTDWAVIDAVIEAHLNSGADYTANTWGRRTFPKGLDVDVVTSATLIAAAREATEPYEREHVLPYVYRHPERFRLDGYAQAAHEGELRWTVDLPEDYEFVGAVYEGLYPADPAFTSDDVRRFLAAHPELANAGGFRRI